MNDLNVKKCMKCGALVIVVDDCKCDNCGIKCCNQEMSIKLPNVEDASYEKHMPEYEIIDNKIKVVVNHPMEEDHYIEFIALVKDDLKIVKYLNYKDEASVVFDLIEDSTIYAMCNKHGLWKKDIK